MGSRKEVSKQFANCLVQQWAGYNLYISRLRLMQIFALLYGNLKKVTDDSLLLILQKAVNCELILIAVCIRRFGVQQ
jgi:hypothetical protein